MGDTLGVDFLVGRRLSEIVKHVHEIGKRDGHLMHPVAFLPELAS